MQHTKIEWVRNADGTPGYVWNPVWGCNKGCAYCYARRICHRFWNKIYKKESDWRDQNAEELAKYKTHYDPSFFVLVAGAMSNFEPTWLWTHYLQKFPAEPSVIFVDSMSDIMYWNTDWMNLVLQKIARHPEHTFLFLTKNIQTYLLYTYPANCWLGVSIDTQERLDSYQRAWEGAHSDDVSWFANRFFISAEPMLDAVYGELLFEADWIIAGAQTGGKKADRVVPEKYWIKLLKSVCEAEKKPGEEREYLSKKRIPFFIKNNLKKIWEDKLIQEIPEFAKK